MNGPEAASIMRYSLQYEGPIIGNNCALSSTLHTFVFDPGFHHIIVMVLTHIYICIVGVTGNALPDDIARFIANGASEVITKPLTKSKLLGAISRYKEL